MARILVIDDDPDIREVTQRMLQSAGHIVTLAADGLEGLACMRSAPADLVIADLYMPGKEGVETIQELRQRFHELPIIAISGKLTAAVTMLTVARHLGALATLQKPFSREELLEAVEKAL